MTVANRCSTARWLRPRDELARAWGSISRKAKSASQGGLAGPRRPDQQEHPVQRQGVESYGGPQPQAHRGGARKAWLQLAGQDDTGPRPLELVVGQMPGIGDPWRANGW